VISTLAAGQVLVVDGSDVREVYRWLHAQDLQARRNGVSPPRVAAEMLAVLSADAARRALGRDLRTVSGFRDADSSSGSTSSDPLVSAAEVAERLGLADTSSVRRRAAQGVWPAMKVGGVWWFRESWLEQQVGSRG
jgi:hypothetical protein